MIKALVRIPYKVVEFLLVLPLLLVWLLVLSLAGNGTQTCRMR